MPASLPLSSSVLTDRLGSRQLTSKIRASGLRLAELVNDEREFADLSLTALQAHGLSDDLATKFFGSRAEVAEGLRTTLTELEARHNVVALPTHLITDLVLRGRALQLLARNRASLLRHHLDHDAALQRAFLMRSSTGALGTLLENLHLKDVPAEEEEKVAREQVLGAEYTRQLFRLALAHLARGLDQRHEACTVLLLAVAVSDWRLPLFCSHRRAERRARGASGPAGCWQDVACPPPVRHAVSASCARCRSHVIVARFV